jgi:hypothetical protein
MKNWFLLIALLFASSAMCADVTVAWNAPYGETPISYTVYVGSTHGTYAANHNAGTSRTYTVTGLANGTWYFAVTAVYATSESEYSNEIFKTIADPIVEVSKCDINADGKINILDSQLLTNYIRKGGTISGGDLNSDGKINKADLTILKRVILGRQACP